MTTEQILRVTVDDQRKRIAYLETQLRIMKEVNEEADRQSKSSDPALSRYFIEQLISAQYDIQELRTRFINTVEELWKEIETLKNK